MRFIRQDEHGAWELQGYLQYLDAAAGRLPAGAREFTLAAWHYDLRHSQCPHDSWLEQLSIRESSSGERRQIRGIEISARFFGAYHDGHFDLVYRGVSAYSLNGTATMGRRGHGDWIIDEITLADANTVHHEIAFEESTLSIDCVDLQYRWTPVGPATPAGRHL